MLSGQESPFFAGFPAFEAEWADFSISPENFFDRNIDLGNRHGNIDVEVQFLREASSDDDFVIKFIKVDTRNRTQMSDYVSA